MSSTAPEKLPLRIFIVENHPDTLAYLTMYLEMLGHTVLSAQSLKEGAEALPTADCDVVISDIGLPDGSGWDLLLRAQLTKPIYAIAMSGFGLGDDRQRSEAAGFRHHVLKPFDPDDLEVLLEEAAREKAA